MLQYPAFMIQYPWSTETIPASYLLPAQWPHPQNDDMLLAMEESDFDEKLNEIGKINSNLTVIGKVTVVDNEKEDFDNEAEDDDVDNGEESEGEDFDQETG